MTYPWVQTSLVLSVYLTISLSVERYISVLHPLVSIRLHSGSSCLPLTLPAVPWTLLIGKNFLIADLAHLFEHFLNYFNFGQILIQELFRNYILQKTKF